MEAIDMIQYLQQFSRTVDFRDLADLFREAEDLDRAAVRACGRWHLLCQDFLRATCASARPGQLSAHQ